MAALRRAKRPVEDLGPLVGKLGLTTEALQSDVERWLRQGGLSITPDADAYLYVHVTVADPGASLPLPYVVEVSLMQEVTLPRGLKTRTPLQCPTWSVNRLGLTTSDRLRTLLSDRVNEFVDQLVARTDRSIPNRSVRTRNTVPPVPTENSIGLHGHRVAVVSKVDAAALGRSSEPSWRDSP